MPSPKADGPGSLPAAAGQLLAHEVRPDHAEAGTLGQGPGQGGLAGAGQAADQDEAGLPARLLQLAERQQPGAPRLRQGHGPVGRRDLRPRQLQAFHLAPHGRPVGRVEGDERAALAVARGQEVRLRERPGQVPMALELSPMTRKAMSATGSAKRKRSLNSMQSMMTRSPGGSRSGK